jgi:hypothetical protein
VDGTAFGSSDLGVPPVSPSSVTFAPLSSLEERSQSITLRIAPDAIDETNETFQLQLSDAVGAVVDSDKSHVQVTIVDDDPAPALTINSASIVEGDAGTSQLVFTVTLSGATEQLVKFDFATFDGTAKSGGLAPDYQETKGSLEFKPGDPTTQEIRVPVFGDIYLEGTQTNRSESFEVRLSNPSNAIVAAATGIGTIVDDSDSIVGITVKDRRAAEGSSGSSAMRFDIELTGQTDQAITFTASTRSGTAASGVDFTKLQDQSVTIPAGQSSGGVQVNVIGDSDFEGGATEHFFLVLDDVSSNASFLDREARGTIYNDDLLQVNARTVKYMMPTVMWRRCTFRRARSRLPIQPPGACSPSAE